MSTTLNKLASNLNKKAAIDPEVLKYLAMYGAPTVAGAGIGAIVDKKKRLRGGILGALLGLGTGGLVHGGLSLYDKYKKHKTFNEAMDQARKEDETIDPDDSKDFDDLFKQEKDNKFLNDRMARQGLLSSILGSGYGTVLDAVHYEPTLVRNQYGVPESYAGPVDTYYGRLHDVTRHLLDWPRTRQDKIRELYSPYAVGDYPIPWYKRVFNVQHKDYLTGLTNSK